MKLLRAAVFAVLAILAVAVAILVVDLWRANNWLDRCADETASDYISDPVARQQACAGGPEYILGSKG